ncbi:MAG: polyprenyl diphosphate synthase [bacterium]
MSISTSAEATPRHIAIIPDGNRRWASEQGLPVFEGHRRGVEVFEEIGDAALRQGVQFVTFWGFSTENWQRSKREVAYLMKLFRWVFTTKLQDFHRKDIRINVLGRVEAFSKDLQRMIRDAMATTKENTRGVVNLALNYGGRAELVDMVKRAIKQRLSPQSVTEENLSRLLYAPEIPDPDLIIRTSGEQRLSGFLPWQGVYSELYFSKKYWPAFTPADLEKAIATFRARRRRFGS